MASKKKAAEAAYGHKSRKRGLSPAAVFFLGAVAVSLIIAGVWQLLSGGAGPDPAPPVTSQSDPSSGGPDSSSGAQDPSSGSQGSSGASGSATALVPKGDWLPTDYFDDALFVGDSITEGIKLYDVMSNAKVLASTGINLNNIFTKDVIETDSGSVTIIEAAAMESPGKIYVMMGANSLLAGEEAFLESYGRLVDALKAQHPEAILYVQSILPVTAAYQEKPSAVADNQTIDRYNAGLLAICEAKGVYYLNVAEDFKDETGALPDEASPKDGIHFGRSWYMTWFDYLRTHGAAVS